ncbi:hypothetical protein BH10BAC6_BH10BAC6_01940 [soil metagenome]
MTRTMQFATVLLLVGFVMPLSAQQPSAEQKAAGKELRTSMRSWFQTSVYPTLTSWKRTYDASLSAEDLTTLNALRVEAARLKGTMKSASKDERHAAMKSIVERAKPIAKRSKDALTSTFTNGKQQIDTWRSEGKAIVDQWHAKYPDAKAHMGMHHMKGILQDGDGSEHKMKRAAIRFMLWDGTLPSDDKAEAQFPGTYDDDAMTLSPAPTEHMTTVRVDGLQDGPATIDVFDMNGTLVKSIPTTVTGGAIEQQIDVSSLNAGTYMASVNSQRGRRTTQLVVHR